ncbi:DNA replication and repair protein RecF [bacterium]|nr:DNA replication and repair protein RecF [bacterium]
MKINSVFISNFRSLSDFSINLPQKLLIKGKTGSGKTSVLEACFVLSSGRSFKTFDIKDCISKDAQNFYIESVFDDFEGYSRKVSVGYDRKGNKRIIIDGTVSSRKSLMNIAYPVVHSPDDMFIITGSPKLRRDFIDRICFIEDKSYFDDMSEYIRYVRNKNIALKDKNEEVVKYLNAAAVPLIDRIRKKRSVSCETINKKIEFLSEKLFSKMKIFFSYNIDENCAEKLESRLEKELEKGFAIYGPHLDNLNITTEIGNAKNNISMGETYISSFIIKLAELSIYAERNEYPIFLIDDIFVFVDDETKKILFKEVESLKNQILMTSSIENINNFNDIEVFYLSR